MEKRYDCQPYLLQERHVPRPLVVGIARHRRIRPILDRARLRGEAIPDRFALAIFASRALDLHARACGSPEKIPWKRGQRSSFFSLAKPTRQRCTGSHGRPAVEKKDPAVHAPSFPSMFFKKPLYSLVGCCGMNVQLTRFSNWCRAKPQELSGFFLKKKPPWNRSETPHRNWRTALNLNPRALAYADWTNGRLTSHLAQSHASSIG